MGNEQPEGMDAIIPSEAQLGKVIQLGKDGPEPMVPGAEANVVSTVKSSLILSPCSQILPVLQVPLCEAEAPKCPF